MYNRTIRSLKHLSILDQIFESSGNIIYNKNREELMKEIASLDLPSYLYGEDGRQMILADVIEYIIFGRGFYAIKGEEGRESFIRFILRLVNLLMTYENITVESKIRKDFFKKLGENVKGVKQEDSFQNLISFDGKIGLKQGLSEAPGGLDSYFDTMLPKTAGGLWHELLVYIFMLKNDLGYILPLLLTQRFLSKYKHIVPPDFLIISHDKRIYGVEVGIKKEIQSGSFSLRTGIPTATVDTINSRNSDRCPICGKWILFCPYVIRNYSNLGRPIDNIKVKCLEVCDLFDKKEDISEGKCPYTKYSRNKAKTLSYTQHDYASGLHYHYSCVLNSVNKGMKEQIIKSKDDVALITHYPYYAGLEALMED